MTDSTPFLCFSGPSDSGKTTLIERVLPVLLDCGLKVGVYKHDAHRFEMDREGKDSHRYARAGASAVLINDPTHLAYLSFQPVETDAPLQNLIDHFFGGLDLALVEGFKASPHPKIAVARNRAAFEGHFQDGEGSLVGIAAAEPWASRTPMANRDDIETIAGWALDWLNGRRNK